MTVRPLSRMGGRWRVGRLGTFAGVGGRCDDRAGYAEEQQRSDPVGVAPAGAVLMPVMVWRVVTAASGDGTGGYSEG